MDPADARPTEPTGSRERSDLARTIAMAAIIAGLLGIGVLLLSRFVAQTRDASLILTGVWFAVVGGGALLFTRARPDLRKAALAAFAVTALGTAAVGYWTGFRDTTVNEDVVIASESATGAEREAALAGDGGPSGAAGGGNSGGGGAAGGDSMEGGKGDEAESGGGDAGGASGGSGSNDEPAGSSDADGTSDKTKKMNKQSQPSGPVSLLEGEVVGADGHAGTGKAEIVKDGNDRKLVFTDFEVDPGPTVEVYLTPAQGDVSDKVNLGGLKGTRGNQQYSVPNSANLNKYDNVVIYCIPFTTRIAVAGLS